MGFKINEFGEIIRDDEDLAKISTEPLKFDKRKLKSMKGILEQARSKIKDKSKGNVLELMKKIQQEKK